MCAERRKKSAFRRLLFVLGLFAFLVGIFYLLRELLFPKAYEDEIYEYSERYGISQDFVFAVINTESGFDTDATSDAGARGLMQIMEDAFLWSKKHLDVEHTSISYDELYVPEYNIEYGCCMLSYYYQKYQSYELSAAAYHAGTNKVDEWISDGTIDTKAFDADDIPSKATRHYVNKVMTAYKAYGLLYEQE